MQTSTNIYHEAIFISCCWFSIYFNKTYLAASSDERFLAVESLLAVSLCNWNCEQ